MYDSPAGVPAEPRGDDAARQAAPETAPHPYADASLADRGRRLYDHAVGLAELGYAVFPVHGIDNGRCTCGKDCGSKEAGKHPAMRNGCKDATADPVRLAELWTAAVKRFGAKPYNVGLATGAPSGVFVADVDGPNGRATLSALERDHGKLPKSVAAKTGRPDGGRHVYFRQPGGVTVPNSAGKIGPGIDVRGDGGYVVVPPSRHWSGKYEWDISPEDGPLADPPAWLLGLIAQDQPKPKPAPKADPRPASPAATPARDAAPAASPGTLTIGPARTIDDRVRLYLDRVPPAVSGEDGSGHTFGTVCKVLEVFPELRDRDDDDVLDLFGGWNAACVPPWSDRELRHKLSDARRQVGDGPPASASADAGASPGDAPADDWPELSADAYHGYAGEFVRSIGPHTEADPAALLVTFLTAFGNAVGRGPYYGVNGGRHHGNLFATVVGASGRSRKGTSADCVRATYTGLETGQTLSGLSTGEGLINAVRDDAVTEAAGTFTAGGGAAEKRVLVTEPEFARLLKVMARKENTLSAVVRDAWDGNTLSVITRANPLRATEAHVSIVAHITRDELARTLTETDAANGFGNRFLWVLARRSKKLPLAGPLPGLDVLRDRLAAILARASAIGEVSWTPAARDAYGAFYADLPEDRTGLFDAITSRAEAQVIRLALLYAVLDGSAVIDLPHVRAAVAVWNYCDDSARIVFGGGATDQTEAKIRRVVASRPGLTRNELHKAVSHKLSAAAFGEPLARLASRGDIVIVPCHDAGPPAERVYPGVPRSAAYVPASPTSPVATATDATSLRPYVPASPDSGSDGTAARVPTSPRPPARLPETDPMAAVADALAAGPTVPAATLAELLDW